MFRRRVVGSLRLHQRGLCGIQIAARNGAFGKELFPRLHDALIQIEIGFCLREIQFGLLCIFGYLRLGCRCKRSLAAM